MVSRVRIPDGSPLISYLADVAELADALDLGSSVLDVGVRVSSSAPPATCGSGSVGRASPCQGEGRGFEPRLPLQIFSNNSYGMAP